MNRIIAAIKKIRLGQVVMTCLAGILLFVSTACSGAVQAKGPDGVVTGKRQQVPAGELAVPGKKENPRPEVPGGTATSPDSDVINRFQGGPTMNEFSDVDPRASDLAKSAASKAEALRENAERNVIDQTSNVGENTRRILDKKGENVEQAGTNLKRSFESATEKAQGTAEDLAKGTKRGTENIKDNTADATKGVTRNASQAAEDVKDNTRDLTKSAKQATNEASGFFKSKANQAADTTQRNLNQAADAVKDAVD